MEKGVDYGIYHSVYKNSGRTAGIDHHPNKDHHTDLDLCLRAIETRATYRNVEFIIVENNSTEKETLNTMKRFRRNFPMIHVVTWERELTIRRSTTRRDFAKGEYLLF